MRGVFKGLLAGGSLLLWSWVLASWSGRRPLPEDPAGRKAALIADSLWGRVGPWTWRIGFASLAAGIIGRLVTGHF